MTAKRHTTTRDHHRRTIARTKPDCGICGQPIDYTAPYLDPGEYVVDHIIPLANAGHDTPREQARQPTAPATAPSPTNCPRPPARPTSPHAPGNPPRGGNPPGVPARPPRPFVI